jgi:hypothetical protein
LGEGVAIVATIVAIYATDVNIEGKRGAGCGYHAKGCLARELRFARERGNAAQRLRDVVQKPKRAKLDLFQAA